MTAPPFPPAPRFCRTAQLTEAGVVLGGTILVPLLRCANGAVELAVSGREAEIFALLSLAQGLAIHKNVLHGLQGVAKTFSQGNAAGAAIRLAQIRLPPLRGPRDAEMLKTGETFLAKGVSPWTILHAAGLEGQNIALFKAEFDQDKHPRDPNTGQFTETGGSTSNNNGKEKTSDHHTPWSAAIDAASQWLQTPVPEYDQDTGEQVGTRPRWRAIVTNPVTVGAVGAAALLGGEAVMAPAAADVTFAPAGRGLLELNPSDFYGKTAAEVDRMALDAGLLPKGPSPVSGKGAYIDPATGDGDVPVIVEKGRAALLTLSR
jgi:hypothetical protein